ncbi:hypothetical protein [Qipengyuania sp. JC766]|uniref:hypothetical protein n=1 Tax=Qipengyuania sp. JC766 TaxID=3232139 RepID=UPI00345B2F94
MIGCNGDAETDTGSVAPVGEAETVPVGLLSVVPVDGTPYLLGRVGTRSNGNSYEFGSSLGSGTESQIYDLVRISRETGVALPLLPKRPGPIKSYTLVAAQPGTVDFNDSAVTADNDGDDETPAPASYLVASFDPTAQEGDARALFVSDLESGEGAVVATDLLAIHYMEMRSDRELAAFVSLADRELLLLIDMEERRTVRRIRLDIDG